MAFIDFMVRFCKTFLKYALFVVFLFLSVISLLETQRHGSESLGEIVNEAPIYKISDSPLSHMAGISALVLLFCFLMFLHRKHSGRNLPGQKQLAVFQLTVSVLSGLISYLILLGGIRTPIADQIQVYNAALCFNEGNYINLSPGGYVDMYPQQLGYILYLQILFRLTGSSGFYLVQVVNCLFIAGTVFGACLVLNDITKHPAARILGTLLLLFLLPLHLLGSWVYGDVPFLFFAFLFIHFCLNTLKGAHCGTLSSGSRSWIPVFCITCLTAVLCLLFRKNALILFIAAAITALVSFAESRAKHCLALAVCVCTLPLCTSFLLEKHYENISGYEIRGGLPSIAWIAMGTIENGSTPGWFNNFSVPVYISTGYNREETAKIAVRQLEEQLSYFSRNPGYAVSFLKRKICTQWNDPFFNTNVLIKVDEPAEPTGLSLLLKQKTDFFRTVLSVLQSIIYMGAFFHVLFLAKDRRFYTSLPELFVLGGFLFSILWEGNSRYILPYFMACFPLAGAGWHLFLTRVFSKTRQFRLQRRTGHETSG